MVACSECGKPNEAKRPFCECGNLLVGDNDNTKSWEHKTFVPGKRRWTLRQVLPLSIWAAIICSVLALVLADSRVREYLLFADAHTPQSETVKGNSAANSTFGARVLSVTDGDTIVVIDGELKELTVKLAGVDAPDLADYFGPQSKENLASLILNKTVAIHSRLTLDGPTVVGKVVLNGRNINLEQLRAGYAWMSGDAMQLLPAEDLEAFKDTEIAARSSKIGLWTKWDVIGGEADTVFNTESGGKTPDGIFTFPGQARSQNASLKTLHPDKNLSLTGTPRVAPLLNPYNERSPEELASRKEDVGKDETDCKPDASVALKITDGPAVEVKALSRSNDSGRNYIAGPRGGCFYLTASGGKKYVDRGLCGQATAAARP